MALPARPLSLLLYNQNLCDLPEVYMRHGFSKSHDGLTFAVTAFNTSCWKPATVQGIKGASQLPLLSSFHTPKPSLLFPKSADRGRYDFINPSPSRLCPPQN